LWGKGREKLKKPSKFKLKLPARVTGRKISIGFLEIENPA
jgi:hypothetical protein